MSEHKSTEGETAVITLLVLVKRSVSFFRSACCVPGFSLSHMHLPTAETWHLQLYWKSQLLLSPLLPSVYRRDTYPYVCTVPGHMMEEVEENHKHWCDEYVWECLNVPKPWKGPHFPEFLKGSWISGMIEVWGAPSSRMRWWSKRPDAETRSGRPTSGVCKAR